MEARKYYLNKESFTKDLQLIFDNAKAYNKPNTIYYNYAVKLEEYISPHLNHMTDPTSVELQEYEKIVKIKESQQEAIGSSKAIEPKSMEIK